VGPAPEGGHADDGIGGRAARHLHTGPHRGVECSGSRLVDQVHGALDQALPPDELLALVAQDVDQRVADAEDVDRAGGVSHEYSLRSLCWVQARVRPRFFADGTGGKYLSSSNPSCRRVRGGKAPVFVITALASAFAHPDGQGWPASGTARWRIRRAMAMFL